MLVAFLDKWKTEKSFLQPQMCALVLVVRCQLQLHVNIVDKVNCPLAWSWTFQIPWQDAPEGCNMQVTTAKGDERSMCIRCYYIRRGSFASMKQHELLSLLQTCPPLKTKSFEFDQFYFLLFFPSTSLLQTAKSSIRFFSESFAFLNFAGSMVNMGKQRTISGQTVKIGTTCSGSTPFENATFKRWHSTLVPNLAMRPSMWSFSQSRRPVVMLISFRRLSCPNRSLFWRSVFFLWAPSTRI